jgi:hypothetical protein
VLVASERLRTRRGHDPSEIENMALVEALFLQKYAARMHAATPAEPTLLD